MPFTAGYVAAQYRFLVKPTGDYTAYFADADIYLNWADILVVLIPTSSALSGVSTSAASTSSQPSLETHEGAVCPICLSPPTSPRMTKCGHVYCFPCILQYLSTTDTAPSQGPLQIPGAAATASIGSASPVSGPSSRQWKRCPVCWDAVYARDLKAVKWWDPKSIAHDRDISGATSTVASEDRQSTDVSASPPDWLRMRLVERPQITTLALPQSSTWPTSSTSPSDQPLIAQHQAPWHFQPDVMAFAKFMLATPELLLASLTQDIDEIEDEKKLLKSLGPSNGDNTLGYVDLAEKKVREQIGKVMTELDTPLVQSAIGQARNDLKEHEEAEKGRILREGENLSRRQRRQAAKQEAAKAASSPETPPDAQLSESGQTDSVESESSRTESKDGAEDFLALRAANQGGSYGVPSPHAKPLPEDSRTEESATETLTNTRQSAKPRRNLNPPNPSSSSYFFYQASSGQNIFMHPLDIKIMHSQFGSYARFPRDIAVKVQGAEEGSMNEDLRKRCKYLTHLPKGTDVVFIEIDWELMASSNRSTGTPEAPEFSQPLVAKSTLKSYEQILKARRNKRRDRERREDRAKLKAEEAEAAKRPGAAFRPRNETLPAHAVNTALSGSLDSDRGAYLSGFASDDGAGQDHERSGRSPTFMEAALWGAEREFPIHPGNSATGDFPAVSGPTNASPRLTASDSPASRPAGKTVWGTPAARPSFSSAVHASSRQSSHQHGWDEDVDEAWLELEEGFVLGTNNSKQVRHGRGLNTQHVNSVAQEPQQQRQSPRQVPGSGQPAENESTSNANSSSAKGKKQRKAKLVLTSGGRGTG